VDPISRGTCSNVRQDPSDSADTSSPDEPSGRGLGSVPASQPPSIRQPVLTGRRCYLPPAARQAGRRR
jgi:hypothetical protein